MRLSGRRWATAFAVAVLIHAGVVAVLLWQAPDPRAGAAGPGVIRVSLGRTGGSPASSASMISQVPEAEMAAAVEAAAGSPIDDAVPTEAPETAMPVENTVAAKQSTTSVPVEAVDVEKAVQAVAPGDAVPLEPDAQAVNIEVSEPEAVAVAEAVVEPPVEEAAASPTPEPVRQAPVPADATESGVVAPAEAPAGPVPLQTIETAVRQAETSGLPDTEPTVIRVPDAEVITVAEAVTGAPIGEVIATSPEPIAPARVPADSIEAEMVAQIEPAADSAPPDAEVELVEPVQSVRDRPAQHPVHAATGGARDEVAGGAAVAPPSSGESDASQSMMPATGPGARIGTVGNPAAHQRYLRKVLERIARFKRYPREARRDGVVGKVMVRFTVLADGRLQSPQLTGSSGDSRLDQAALDMLSRASPLPPIPRSLGVGKLELSLPVEFSLSRKRTLF